MSITIAQVPATWNIDANLTTVREVLGETHPGDVVVLPEGMLSGYGEDLTPLDTIDSATVNHAIAQTAQLAVQKQVHIFCGSLLPLDGGWCNAGLFFPAHGGYRCLASANIAHPDQHCPSMVVSPAAKCLANFPPAAPTSYGAPST